MTSIASEQQVLEGFIKEPVDYWVCSFGGCRSQYIERSLSQKHRVVNSIYRKIACHSIQPINVPVKALIFVYAEDVGIAICSQISRNLTENYQKMSNNTNNQRPVARDWLKLIELQIHNWTSNTILPTYIINSDRLGDVTSRKRFKRSFGVDLLEFKDRRTDEYWDKSLTSLPTINRINRTLKDLPDFKLINGTWWPWMR